MSAPADTDPRTDHEPNGSAPATPSAHDYVVDVRSETLRQALVQVGTSAGWRVRATVAPDTYLIVDGVRATEDDRTARRTVLVVDATPFAASTGLQVLSSGLVASVMLGTRPSGLVFALESLQRGWGAVPDELLELALRMPHLTERQLAVVGAVIAGQSTAEISRGLFLSEASVKRELATLYRSFDLRSRVALAALGSSLGVLPRRLSP